MCTIYVSYISSILYFEFHHIMQHKYNIICGNLLATLACQKFFLNMFAVLICYRTWFRTISGFLASLKYDKSKYCNVAIVTLFDILQNGDRNLHFTDGTSMVHFTQCLFHLYNEDSFNYNEDCFILYICILYVYIYVLQACCKLL